MKANEELSKAAMKWHPAAKSVKAENLAAAKISAT
jgi:hypothetical protein